MRRCDAYLPTHHATHPSTIYLPIVGIYLYLWREVPTRQAYTWPIISTQPSPTQSNPVQSSPAQVHTSRSHPSPLPIETLLFPSHHLPSSLSFFPPPSSALAVGTFPLARVAHPSSVDPRPTCAVDLAPWGCTPIPAHVIPHSPAQHLKPEHGARDSNRQSPNQPTDQSTKPIYRIPCRPTFPHARPSCAVGGVVRS